MFRNSQIFISNTGSRFLLGDKFFIQQKLVEIFVTVLYLVCRVESEREGSVNEVRINYHSYLVTCTHLRVATCPWFNVSLGAIEMIIIL